MSHSNFTTDNLSPDVRDTKLNLPPPPFPSPPPHLRRFSTNKSWKEKGGNPTQVDFERGGEGREAERHGRKKYTIISEQDLGGASKGVYIVLYVWHPSAIKAPETRGGSLFFKTGWDVPILVQ